MPFNTDDPTMLDDWLVAGPAAALAGTSDTAPRAARLLGETLHLWRDAAGKPQCRLGSQALAVQSRHGYLWVCPGGKPARPLFDFPEYGEAGRRTVDCGGIGVAVSGLRVIENFLDMAHFPFVHAGILGQVPHTEVARYQVQVDPATREIWATDCRFWQPRASAAHGSGSEVIYKYRVMQPLTAMLYKSSSRAGKLDAIGLFLQPLDDEHVIAHTLLACYDARADGDAPSEPPRPNPEHLYFVVSDLEDAFDRAFEAGCRQLDAAIETRPWGERSFYLVDPFGNPLCFVDERTRFSG